MLNAARAYAQNVGSTPAVPLPEELHSLAEVDFSLRHGEVTMIAGRPGAGKSAFALYLAAKSGASTLYCAGDMTAADVTTRLGAIMSGETLAQVEQLSQQPEHRQRYLDLLSQLKITFLFGAPIGFENIRNTLNAYMELHNKFPEIIVIDSLYDSDEATETDWSLQMAAMAEHVQLARETGSAVIVLHHAVETGERARQAPGLPPARAEIANKLAQKPAVIATVALWSDIGMPDKQELRLAVVKNRYGRASLDASNYIRLKADASRGRFASMFSRSYIGGHA